MPLDPYSLPPHLKPLILLCCAQIVSSSSEKNQELIRILRSKPPGTRIIIFCGTKRMCDQLTYAIGREFRAAAIHGDKRQQERDAVLAAFKNGSTPVLVATDVAARGLDIPNVGAVRGGGRERAHCAWLNLPLTCGI